VGPEVATASFEAQRPRLLRLAYRMLGSMSEAEDVVQDAWLRWQRSDIDAIANPAAWLSRTVSRLCLDVMKSSRHQREVYPGTWLPEPVVDPDDEGPRADELTMTLMIALERLSPLERAAFLLHDVFGVPLTEVADTLERDPAAVRQLATRARRHVQADRPRHPLPKADGERIALAFFEASRAGDATALGQLLAEQVSVRSDGGGKVRAFPNVVEGTDRTLRLFLGLSRKFGEQMILLRPVWIDGLPGFLSRINGTLQSTALEIEDGRVVAIYITRNPEKLRYLDRDGLH
jgi:RNA polymerase sigma-70 factor (ECF subfamily)